MVANAASIPTVAQASPEERDTLFVGGAADRVDAGKTRPCWRRPVSPGLSRVGVMLAYAPVHHLLFAALAGHDFASHDPHVANDFRAGRHLGQSRRRAAGG